MEGISLHAGFADPVADAQRVFRAALEAMSRPGRVFGVDAPAKPAPGLGRAATALALALVDHDTPVWLGEGCRAAAEHLRFHCGAPLAPAPAGAAFAFLRAKGDGVDLNAWAMGTDGYPDRSATLVLEVTDLESGPAFMLAGPGIDGHARVRWSGLPADFPGQWAANRASYPLGVDVILTADDRLCGLPRTVRIEE